MSGLDEWIMAGIGGGFSRRGKGGRNPWGTRQRSHTGLCSAGLGVPSPYFPRPPRFMLTTAANPSRAMQMFSKFMEFLKKIFST